MNDTVNQATKMLATLGNKQLQNDATRVSQIDPMSDLKDTLIGFFKDRVKTVTLSEEFRLELVESLRKDLRLEKLSFDQKMLVLSRISNEGNEAADSLLQIFKPSPGAPSMFMEFSRKEDKADEMAQLFRSMTPEQLQHIDDLFQYSVSLAKGAEVPPLAESTPEGTPPEEVPGEEGVSDNPERADS